MYLSYDPADGNRFWESISKLDGYPRDEIMPIKRMLFESNALYQTSRVLESIGADKNNPLIVIMDQTSMKRGNDSLKPLALGALKNDGWQILPVVMLPDKSGQVQTEMPRIKGVQKKLKRGCAVLSIGSGVITDIAKHACYLYQQETAQKIPFVVYQTANSVNAFTSNMAPTFVDGVKRTLDSRYPDALLCDLETLRDAPKEMTVAGIGDMLAVFVSIPDWILAHRLGMDDSYSELPKQLLGSIYEILSTCAANIDNIEGAALLAKVMALGGLAMSLTHATTPLSGFEHVMSHVIDLQADLKHEPLAMHGSQVALTSIAGAEMYRRFLTKFDPASIDVKTCFPAMESMRTRIEKSFASLDPSGKVAAECWSDYKQKLARWHERRKDFESALRDWLDIREQLRGETRPPEALIQILGQMDAPLNWSQLKPAMDAQRARFAFLHASLIRKRFTLGDLLIFLNWDRESLWKEIHYP